MESLPFGEERTNFTFDLLFEFLNNNNLKMKQGVLACLLQLKSIGSYSLSRDEWIEDDSSLGLLTLENIKDESFFMDYMGDFINKMIVLEKKWIQNEIDRRNKLQQN